MITSAKLNAKFYNCRLLKIIAITKNQRKSTISIETFISQINPADNHIFLPYESIFVEKMKALAIILNFSKKELMPTAFEQS